MNLNQSSYAARPTLQHGDSYICGKAGALEAEHGNAPCTNLPSGPGAVAVCVASLMLASGALAQDQVHADLEQAARAVVRIDATIADRAQLGAGVVAVRERDAVVIVTANHVVRQGATSARAIVVHFKDKPQEALAGTLLPSFDKTDDIAVLRVERLRERGIDPCRLPALAFDSAQVVKRGHGVYLIGNPAGVAWHVPVMADTVTDVGGRAITFQSALIDNGHSGGGLFNAFADLVGIIRADQPPYGIATRADRTWALLRAWMPIAPADACTTSAAPPVASLRSPPSTDSPAAQAQAWVADPSLLTAQWRPLFDAIQHGDVAAIKSSATPQALSPAVDGTHPPFPLHLAAQLGQVGVVKQLLLMGARKSLHVFLPMPGSAPKEEMGSPLHMAARANQVEVIKVLVAAGAAVEEGEDGSASETPGTPLATAARHGRLDAAQALISAGASLNAGAQHYDGYVRTPVGRAVANGQVDMLRLLKQAGAPFRASWVNSALLYTALAVQRDQLGSLRYLLSLKLPLDCKPSGGCRTPVLEALSPAGPMSDGRRQALQMVLAAGADPNSDQFESYIAVALAQHNPEAVRMLLKAGANPNAKTREGKTLLQLAQAGDENDAVEALKAFGAKR